MSTKILQNMLKLDFTLPIMNQIDCYQKEEIKSNWINERRIRWKNYEKICWTKSENLQLIDYSSEDKKVKDTKKCIIKRKLKSEN